MPAPLDRRLLARSAAVRRLLVAAAALGVAIGLLAIAQAWFVAATVDALVGGSEVTGVAATVGAVLLLRAGAGWVQTTLAARAAGRVKGELRHGLVDVLLDPSRTGAASPHSGRLSLLLADGLDRLDPYVGRFLPQMVVTVTTPALVVVALLLLDPLSALVVALTVPLVVVFLVLVGLATRDRLDRRWSELGRLGRHFSDVLGGIVLLKVFGRDQSRAIRDVGERHRRATTESLRTAFTSSLVLELFSTLSVALVAVSAGLRLVSGGLDLATALFVIVVAPEAYLPLRRLGSQFHDSADGVTTAQEALDLLDLPRRGPGVPPPATGDLVVDGVRVEHAGRDVPALSLGSARFARGEVVAVVGPSGAGKSTLLGVLLGLTEPTAGRVLVGDVDLARIDVEQWWQRVAWVPQFPVLVGGTVADNVRLGTPDADDAAVLAALADAGASDLALGRRVREGAADLSTGERRRVAIARALLRVRAGADLLLLDEPTAGLDVDAEAAVLAAVRGLDATVVVVAHRPRTIAAADRVVHLEPAGVAA